MPNVATTTAPILRFYRHVKWIDGCLVWIGHHAVGKGMYGKRGYFFTHYDGKKRKFKLAHKWFYEWNHGPVPEGKELGHLPECKHKPLCVAHVRPVTHRENILEAPTCVSAIAASKTHCPQGHEYNAKNMRIRRGFRECKICTRERKRVPGGPGIYSSKRTHCPQGHEYSVENTYHSRGKRICKLCTSTKAKEKRRLSLTNITTLRSNENVNYGCRINRVLCGKYTN